MDRESPVLQFIGYWGYRIYEERELLQMELHLLLSALFPIYVGSQASLRRPPSAAKPTKKTKSGEAADEEEEDIIKPTVEGLRPSDAILIPFIASLTLGGLYLLIKWLEDPAILNKILGIYLSVLGVAGVGKLAGDALNVVTTFVFPSVWSSPSETFYIDPVLSAQLTGSSIEAGKYPLHRKFVEDKPGPLPGILSRIRLSTSVTKGLWTLRAILTDHWLFRGYVHGLMYFRTKIRLNDAIGYLIGLAVILFYNLYARVWFLTNLMGFGFCYGTLQLMSPTTFATGSLILGGLFIYDITMVFYTPLMVTVATKLDVPIKLVFPGPSKGGMLGLGDVVLPGIMIALALRFDLYLHYLKQQKQPSQASTQMALRNSKAVTTLTKTPYLDATGHWGERFWTSSAPPSTVPAYVRAGQFKKTYFYAAMLGYVLAMTVTVIVLNVFHHAQPALLYLVPGVLGALWGTAAIRGELSLMWNYTEDGSLDIDSNFDASSDGSKKENDTVEINGKAAAGGDKTVKEEEKEKSQIKLDVEKEQPVFYFILTAPKRGLAVSAEEKEKPKWA